MKECNQCGKCCIKYGDGGLSASDSEIEFWEIFRPHIHRYVSDGKIWIDPKTNQPLKRCPWLIKASGENKYSCEIYYDRPDDCKYYPVNIQEMIRDECEMLEPKDFKQPRQAQNILNRLMADSRTSFE